MIAELGMLATRMENENGKDKHCSYRKLAIQSLALNHGDTVVDLGCGTEPREVQEQRTPVVPFSPPAIERD